MCAPLHSLHPNNPLSNREGTTGSPSATNLVQTKAKSARISHYTCFPSSLSPERTREKKRGFWGFHPLRQRSFKPTRGSHFAPHSHCSERCEEEWGGSARSQLLETSARVEKMRSFCYRLELKDTENALKRDWNSVQQSGITESQSYSDGAPLLCYEQGAVFEHEVGKTHAVMEEVVSRSGIILQGCGRRILMQCWSHSSAASDT